MTPFDTVVIVDWSGGNDRGPTPKADAIWVGVHHADGRAQQNYLRNRGEAETFLDELFTAERQAGRRVFAGFDFPFGYPLGFCEAVTGRSDTLALWDWFESRIEDFKNVNNRFEIAGEINLLAKGDGPFWGNGLKRDIAGLPRRKVNDPAPFPERRMAETLAKGAFTCWQMAGAGSVGSQVMMGLPVLARLRRKFAAKAWPFEPLNGDIALVEVWPSLTAGPAPDVMIKDQWQVAEVARQIAGLAPDTLAEILKVDAPEEGWIFGLGHEAKLTGAPPPLRNDCFALPPGVHWTPVDEALARLKARMGPVVAKQPVAVKDALGRVAAADVFAARSNPPFANTAVDGYGFAGGRGPGAHALPLLDGRAAAGDRPGAVPDGASIRILTGAALPAGVDTVILQEDVQLEDGMVCFSGPVKAGANTRKSGEDMVAGEVVLRSGQMVGPAELAILAATGIAQISVRKKLRVGVLSTGDELVEIGQQALDGQIFDANRPMLLGLASRMGHDPVDLGRAPDDRKALRATLDKAAPQVDVILTSGGASAGDEDHVSALLSEAGAMDLWRIAVKPGRPLALGMWQSVPVFGLPGNPVAAMVCTLIFARPALAVMAGQDWPEPLGFEVPAAFTKSKKPGRREYLRARMREGRAEVFPSEGSGRISGLAWAEGLVELPEPAANIAPGDPVRFIPYGSFGI